MAKLKWPLATWCGVNIIIRNGIENRRSWAKLTNKLQLFRHSVFLCFIAVKSCFHGEIEWQPSDIWRLSSETLYRHHYSSWTNQKYLYKQKRFYWFFSIFSRQIQFERLQMFQLYEHELEANNFTLSSETIYRILCYLTWDRNEIV